jgi:hypothetical protein
MNRRRVLVVSFAAAVLTGAWFAPVAATHDGPHAARLVIRHQPRGCHSWSLNGGPYSAAQVAHLEAGEAILVINLDVMPHRLLQVAGPKVRFRGSRYLNGMSSAAEVVFPQAGVYRLTTRPGEDYRSGLETAGPDHRLTLKVIAS